MRSAFYSLVNFLNTTSIHDVYFKAAKTILLNIYPKPLLISPLLNFLATIINIEILMTIAILITYLFLILTILFISLIKKWLRHAFLN